VRRKNARLLSLSDSSLSSQLQNVPLLIISCMKISTLLRVYVVIVDRQVCQLMLLREERLGRPWCGPSVNLCPSLMPRLTVGPRPRLENVAHEKIFLDLRHWLLSHFFPHNLDVLWSMRVCIFHSNIRPSGLLRSPSIFSSVLQSIVVQLGHIETFVLESSLCLFFLPVVTSFVCSY
jgi:hypothetical protein